MIQRDLQEVDPEVFFGIDYRFGSLDATTCDAVLKLAESFPEANDAFSYGALGTRNSKTCVVSRTANSDWLFELIWERSKLTNLRFNFQFDRLEDPLQIIRYRPSERVDWHIDCGGSESNGGRRKLSMTVQLSHGNEYDGGNLEFMGKQLHPFARERGTMVSFPSFLSHRVTEVTRGLRYSLVAFADGSPFR